jgi:hypothetical protein
MLGGVDFGCGQIAKGTGLDLDNTLNLTSGRRCPGVIVPDSGWSAALVGNALDWAAMAFAVQLEEQRALIDLGASKERPGL